MANKLNAGTQIVTFNYTDFIPHRSAKHLKHDQKKLKGFSTKDAF